METNTSNGKPAPKKKRTDIRISGHKKSTHEHLQRISDDLGITLAMLVKQHLPDIIKLYPQVK